MPSMKKVQHTKHAQNKFKKTMTHDTKHALHQSTRTIGMVGCNSEVEA